MSAVSASSRASRGFATSASSRIVDDVAAQKRVGDKNETLEESGSVPDVMPQTMCNLGQDDLDSLRAQGIAIDNDNKQCPENVPDASAAPSRETTTIRQQVLDVIFGGTDPRRQDRNLPFMRAKSKHVSDRREHPAEPDVLERSQYNYRKRMDVHELLTAPQFCGAWIPKQNLWRQVKQRYQQNRCAFHGKRCTAQVRTYCRCTVGMFLCKECYATHVAEAKDQS